MGSPKLNSCSAFSAPTTSDLPSSVAWTNTAPSSVPNSRTSEFSVGSTQLPSASPTATKASDRSSCVVTWLGSEGSARLADVAVTETAQAMAIADRSRERVRRNKVLFIFFFPMHQVNTGCMVALRRGTEDLSLVRDLPAIGILLALNAVGSRKQQMVLMCFLQPCAPRRGYAFWLARSQRARRMQLPLAALRSGLRPTTESQVVRIFLLRLVHLQVESVLLALH